MELVTAPIEWGRRAGVPRLGGGTTPGRVVGEHRTHFQVATEAGEFPATITARHRKEAAQRSDLPGVGDFVALQLSGCDGPALIEAVLPRTTAMVRKAAGSDAYDGLVGDLATVLDDIDRLRRRQGTLGKDHVPTETGLWNRIEDIERLKRDLGEIDHGPTLKERERIIGRIDAITGEMESIEVKMAPKKPKK